MIVEVARFGFFFIVQNSGDDRLFLHKNYPFLQVLQRYTTHKLRNFVFRNFKFPFSKYILSKVILHPIIPHRTKRKHQTNIVQTIHSRRNFFSLPRRICVKSGQQSSNGKLESESRSMNRCAPIVPRPLLGICMPTASHEDDPDLSRDDRMG